jgi:glycosyltransferase involved in cell wall biosynthesis
LKLASYTRTVRIGIDCRKIADYGIGTYIRGLTHALADLPGDEEYVLFAPPERRHLLPPGARFRWIEETSPNYSLTEVLSLARHRVDLFHAPHYVVPLGSTPLVVTIHDLIHLTQPRRREIERLYAAGMIGRAVRKATAILTVSRAVADQIAERYPECASKITVTPNGVDGRFSPVDEPPAGDTFLFVGNDKPHKNLETLLRAFRAARAADGRAQLLLVGGARVREEGITSRGFVDDAELLSLYRGSLALVQPSLEEGFGLPVLEAMACGLPVIASSAPALVEVAGGAALHFDPLDHAALTDAMLRVASDEALRTKMRRDGLERAKIFSWKRCAEETLRTYREVWNNVEQKNDG